MQIENEVEDAILERRAKVQQNTLVVVVSCSNPHMWSRDGHVSKVYWPLWRTSGVLSGHTLTFESSNQITEGVIVFAWCKQDWKHVKLTWHDKLYSILELLWPMILRLSVTWDPVANCVTHCAVSKKCHVKHQNFLLYGKAMWLIWEYTLAHTLFTRSVHFIIVLAIVCAYVQGYCCNYCTISLDTMQTKKSHMYM